MENEVPACDNPPERIVEECKSIVIDACGWNPAIVALVLGKVRKDVSCCERSLITMRQIRRKTRDCNIARIRVAVTLCTILEYECAFELWIGSVAWIAVGREEGIGDHVVRIGRRIPELIELGVRALEPALVRRLCTEKASIIQGDRGNGDGSIRLSVRGIGVERIKDNAHVAKAVEAIST